MDTTGFRVCPFCQSPVPLQQQRCSDCHRSLAGLPLKVHRYPPSSRSSEDWTPSPGEEVPAGSERRTRKGRRTKESAEPTPARVEPSILAAPPPPSGRRRYRLPIVAALGLVMALAIGWIAVGAGGRDGEDGDRTHGTRPEAGETARQTAVNSSVAAGQARETAAEAPALPAARPPSTPQASAATPVPAPAAPADPTSTAYTAPEAPAEPAPLLVHPEDLTPFPAPAGAEDERLRQARVAALDLALQRRGALLRRIERLEEELASIEDVAERDGTLLVLEETRTQLEISNREVARLRAEARPQVRNRP